MGKPVVGDVVVLPFPQSDLRAGKRRPALVVADLPGDDVVLCQITSQLRPDATSVFLTKTDFASGQLTVDSCVRAGRLFTVDQSVVVYVAATISAAKLDEVKSKLRQLFS
jgi:mRNA interferase MazF